MQADYASISMPGGRPVNEDSIISVQTDRDWLFGLCDGLGGHLCGDEASKCVCAEMKRSFLTVSDPDPERRLRKCVEQSQIALLEAQKTDSRHSGMRTTLCAVLISQNSVSSVYIGDSRIYQFRGGRMLSRTLDHSVPQMMVQLGELREEEIRGNENRNRLLRAMGMPWEIPQYEVWKPAEDAAPGDVFLLCSDGFWEWILESEMEHALMDSAGVGQWLSEMERIVRRAGKKQTADNYSAIALKII